MKVADQNISLPKIAPGRVRELAEFGLAMKARNHFNALVNDRAKPMPPAQAAKATELWLRETYG